MADVADRYRREGGIVLIEMRLARVGQLFNSFDPAPFHEKDLDDDADAWLVDTAWELPQHLPLRLRVHLPPSEIAPRTQAEIQEAVRNYFSYRAEVARLELRRKLQEGRASLGVALLFLVACLTLRELVLGPWHGAWSGVLGEGLLISGWVAMWRPLQILLYERWPLRRRARLLDKLAALDVSVVPSAPLPAARPA